jgi:hypothetical protein
VRLRKFHPFRFALQPAIALSWGYKNEIFAPHSYDCELIHRRRTGAEHRCFGALLLRLALASVSGLPRSKGHRTILRNREAAAHDA